MVDSGNKGKRKKYLLFPLLLFLMLTAGAFLLYNDDFTVLTGGRDIKEERLLIPGGRSVGIQMKVKGALIVGIENNAGPMIGDMIVEVGGLPVAGPEDIKSALEGSLKKVDLTVFRDGKKIKYKVKPYFDRESGEYKLGFWVKERIAGIGTLSFYDPESNCFAALGHGIYENETGILLESRDGSLLNTKVNRVKAGRSGAPGELGGVIYDFQSPLGSIEKNTEFGIYGRAAGGSFENLEPLPAGSQDDIKKGEACIITTVEGTEPREYTINITGINRQRKPAPKGIEFQVTDPELLNLCGGIIQGMSGSPIIQDGRIIGAVTHVFIKDPQKGYGIFAEWMLKEIS